jgi:lysozyme
MKRLEPGASRTAMIAVIAAVLLTAAGCGPTAPKDGADAEAGAQAIAAAELQFETVERDAAGELLESSGKTDAEPSMSVSADGLALLKVNEGVWHCKKPLPTDQHCPYNDSAQYCTIGHGHLIAKQACKDLIPMLTEKGWLDGITDEEAEAILKADLRTAQVGLESKMAGSKIGAAELTPAQYDALVSFIFNVGASKFAKSTLLKKLNARADSGGDPAVAQQFMAWKMAGGQVVNGLLTRRKREVEHFFIGYTVPAEPRDPVEDIDIRVGE